MGELQHHTVVITIDFAEFGNRTVHSQTSALVRPFRLLLDEGKPIGTINYLFYRSSRSYVLGALCLTPRHRILFFPGLVIRSTKWHTRGPDTKFIETNDALLDHLTLEADFRSFHATILDRDSRKDVLVSYPTKTVTLHLIYWFGLSLRSETVLEECPEKISFQFSSQPHDVERRTQIVLDSRRDAKFHIIELNPSSKSLHPCFLHFDFLVDLGTDRSNGLQDLVPGPTTAPTGPPSLKSSVSIPEKVPVRSHPVTIPQFLGRVWVVSSIRMGELVEPAVIGGSG